MATREQRELIDQINALAKKLNVEPPKTDGLSTQQLNERLDELRKLEAATGQQPTSGQQQAGSAATAPSTTSSSTTGSSSYRVARGRSLITARGHLNEGEEVREADVQGGLQHLEELAKAGVLEQGSGQTGDSSSGQPGPGGEPVAPAPGQTTDPNVQQTNQPGTEPGK